jgi:hypothetical protein
MVLGVLSQAQLGGRYAPETGRSPDMMVNDCRFARGANILVNLERRETTFEG